MGKYGPAPVIVHDHNLVVIAVDIAHVSVDHFGAEPDNVDSEFEGVELGSGNY